MFSFICRRDETCAENLTSIVCQQKITKKQFQLPRLIRMSQEPKRYKYGSNRLARHSSRYTQIQDEYIPRVSHISSHLHW